MNAQISRACAECGARFDLTPEQAALIGRDNERRYCDRRCAYAAKRTRLAAGAADGEGCRGCDRPASLTVWQVPFCKGCDNVIGKSCLRKQKHRTARGAVTGPVRGTLTPYRCPLCECWHATAADRPPPAVYLDRLTRIGQALRAAGVAPGAVTNSYGRYRPKLYVVSR